MYPHLVLAGGPGVGKSSFAKRLLELVPAYTYLHMALPAVKIPATLVATTHPSLLSLSKEEYLKTITQHKTLSLIEKNRHELNSYGEQSIQRYGKQIMGEIAHAFCDLNVPTIVDGIAGIPSVQFLQERGFYVVGFRCPFALQVQRRKFALRDMDTGLEMEQVVKRTNDYLDIDGCLNVANLVYDSEHMTTEEIINHFLRFVLHIT